MPASVSYLPLYIYMLLWLKSGTQLLTELRTHIRFPPNIEKISCFIFISFLRLSIQSLRMSISFLQSSFIPAIERLICVVFMVLRVSNNFRSEHETPHLFIHAFELLGHYIHVLSIFCSEHKACHSVSHFSSHFLAYSR